MKKGKILILLAFMFLIGCGQEAKVITETPTVPPPTEPIIVTPLSWEIPVLELGMDYEINMDPRIYISVDDESLYERFVITTNLDCDNPGTYDIMVAGFGYDFHYAIDVKDTEYPTLVVGNCNYIVGPEFEVDIENVMTEHRDNDAKYSYGFYGLEKVKDLSDFTLDEVKDEVPTYETTVLEEGISFVDKLILPAEDGYYTVYVAVKDRAGQASVSKIGFVIDGTPPTINVPKDKVKLNKYKGYNFELGVSVSDNLKGIEYEAKINEEEFAVLQNAYEEEIPGTYIVSYHAKDFVGNETTKSVEITLE